MASKRLQEKLSGTLSGWYTADWGTNIVWNDGNLMIKDHSLGEEIFFNLEEDGLEVELQEPIEPEFQGWATKLVIL
jgi:hypothetical protein